MGLNEWLDEPDPKYSLDGQLQFCDFFQPEVEQDSSTILQEYQKVPYDGTDVQTDSLRFELESTRISHAGALCNMEK